MNSQAERREVLAIVPARRGSKGLPGKNLASLCGKPLISYTLDVLRASSLVTRVLVSTEDEEIASVARASGADVPFLRPKTLSSDCSNLDDAFKYTLERLRDDGYVPDCVVYCFPTSPFKTVQFVDHMIGKLHCGHKSVITVKRMALPQVYYMADKDLNVANSAGVFPRNMQYYKAYDVISGYNTQAAPLRPYVHYIENPIMLIDIDGPDDFLHAETVLKAGLFDFGIK